MGAGASVEGLNDDTLSARTAGDVGMSTPRTGPRPSESASIQGGLSLTAPNLNAVAGSLVSEDASITYKTVQRHGLTKRMSFNNRERMTRRADSMVENTVIISRSGFSSSSITISEGQIVTFQWEDVNGMGFNVTQVVNDGDQFRPVMGGIHSGPLTKRGHFEHQFNMEGEFKFVSAGIRCTPLTINVHSRREIFAKLTDKGFQPPIIRVETGESVKWCWTQCEVPHAMYKAEYCRQHCGLRKVDQGNLLPTVTGSYIYQFKHPGLFYFVATGDNIKNHLCVVHCHRTQREHCIEVKDREFEPNILVIEEGDRVWWKWNKLSCKKLHSVYQIQIPQRGRKVEEPFRPLRDGFRWSQPSKSGLMAQEFFEAGIVFYSDHNFQETAEYAGCIIVKPAVREHTISLSGDGFEPDLLEIQSGERVWWNWNVKDMDPLFNIMEVEKCLTPSAQLADEEECGGGCFYMDDDSARITVRMGLEVFTPLHTGLYHFRISDSPNSISSSSIVVQPGPRNLTVHVTSTGFEPRVLTGVHPGDRVWWVWQGEPGSHNIVQVNHEGAVMDDGFCSGAQMECPAAFTQVFDAVGVFYYISDGHTGTYGAVVVGSQPLVHEVLVDTSGVTPDPLTVRRNDVVVWTFRGLRQHDLVRIESMGQILDAQHKSMVVQPRRCMNRAMSDVGIHHFTSKSFLKTSAKSTTGDESRVSSILVHDYEDSEVVRVSSRGFFPPTLTLRRGQSVLWSWKESGSEEQHNIVHVNPPSSEAPLSVIQGDRAFTSGRPVSQNSFLYTFDAAGMFCVASVGCPGMSCSVLVINEETAFPTPSPSLGVLENGGTVSRNHTVYLDCDDAQARIFYTLDGSPPLLHRKGVKMYKPKEGIVLRKPGLYFIRAISVADNSLTSAIFTSKRFWVLQNVDEAISDDACSIETLEDVIHDDMVEGKEDSWQWWNCVPAIKSVPSAPGVIDVFWEPVPKACEELIKGYQIYLNGVTYGPPFDSSVNCLSVTGLAGGRAYDAWLHVDPVNPMFLPHKSNHLMLTVPKLAESGGPLISIERPEEVDMLAIVWMSISTRDRPIQGYFLGLNGRRCGQMVVPEPDSSRCKVVIEGCALDRDYQIQVFAISALTEEQEFPSNEIFVHLPLETSDIVVPDTAEAAETPELYREFVVVNEGSGFHLAVEDDSHRKRLRSLIRRDTVIEADDDEITAEPENEEPTETEDTPLPQDEEEEVETQKAEEHVSENEELSSPRIPESEQEQTVEEPPEESLDQGMAVPVVPEVEQQPEEEEAVQEEVKEEEEKEEVTPHAEEDRLAVNEPEEKHEVVTEMERDVEPSTVEAERGLEVEVDETEMESPSAGRVVEVQTSVDLSYVSVPVVEEPAVAAVPVPVIPSSKRDDVEVSALPAPEVELITTESEDRFSSALTVEWSFSRSIPHHYFLRMCIVNVIGNRFASNRPVNSNISFEASHPDLGLSNALQHCWNVLEGTRCVVSGLKPGETYKVFVVADYVLLHGRNNGELQNTAHPEQQVSSSILSYTTLGPPDSPSLWADSSGMYEVTLGWSQNEVHSNDELIGFRLLVEGSPFGEMLSPITKFSTLNNLSIGSTFPVSLVAVSRTGGQSTPSNEIQVTCPHRPLAPQLRQEPAFSNGSIVVAWDYPTRRDRPPSEDITKYSVYVDGQWRDEVPAHHSSRSYQYQVDNLLPGVIYDVTVKALAGQEFIRGDTAGDHVFCLVESEFSPTLSVTCIAPPASPQLKIESMNSEGLELAWDQAQSFGEAATTGYQLLRDGQPYGAVIPSDVTTLTVRDLTLGQRISLQLVALTNHPVAHRSGDDTGVDGLPDRYGNCVAGPTLTVHYTGLVTAPRKVWCEAVTGHSAMIIWDKDDHPKPHHVQPDNYQVTWWPGERPDREIHSEATTEDYLVIENLQSDTLYTVHVEARKLQSYDQFNEEESTLASGTFILTGRSDPLTIRTAEPPEAPSNLGVIATTCHSILIAWDPPKERGVEVSGLHVRCSPSQPSQSHQVHTLDLVPDATRALIPQLSERTEYCVSVFAVTEEFFHTLPTRDPMRDDRKLRWPADGRKPQTGDSAWLPSASILASTSGTHPASNIQVVSAGCETVELRWKPPQVFGSNRLKGQVVRWCEVRRGMPAETAEHLSLDPKDRRVTLEGLLPGALYRVSLEAIVSVKSNISEDETGVDDEKRNRRTAHVPAEPLLVRTRSPADPPNLLVTGITESSISLYWERPILYTIVASNPHDESRYIRRHLEGYRLLVNGRAHTRLKSSAQTVTLTKCRPGKEYRVVLVALTLTDDAKKEMRRRAVRKSDSRISSAQSRNSDVTASMLKDEDIDVNFDEAQSEPLDVRLQSSEVRGAVRAISARYLESEEAIHVDWTLDNTGAGIVRQVDLRWRIEGETRIHQKTLDSRIRETKLTKIRNKAVYHITVEPVLLLDSSSSPLSYTISVQTPGSPEPPRICTRSVSEREIMIEWAEPRLYGGVGIRGYQLMMNERSVGSILHTSHRKAIIPSRPNRHYKISLVALSAHSGFADSGPSNSLLISTSSDGRPFVGPAVMTSAGEAAVEGGGDASGASLPVRVSAISDTSLTLDWLSYLPPSSLSHFKLQWWNAAQSAERWQRLDGEEKSCVLSNCLPGMTHFVRVTAYSDTDEVLDKSSQLRVQTCAPIEAPTLSQRAANFSYVSVQWAVPKTFGDALTSGYKVYVNGVVEAILSKDELAFSYTQGRWCHDYVFQVQALCADTKFSSRPSEPLTITWPGCQPSLLSRRPSTASNSVRVGWDEPYSTEGVTLKHFRILCTDLESQEIVQTVGPLHPDTREAELNNLPRGTYSVYLEVHLHGTKSVVQSDSLTVQPTLTPDPPRISVVVIGLEERKQIERVTCELINRRDKLVRFITGLNRAPSRSFDENELLSKATEAYNEVEDMIEDCFSSLSHYTGHLLAQLSWTAPQTSEDVTVTGYKVLVDGKQYGCSLHAGIHTVRVKLSVDVPLHRLTMIAMSERPLAISPESNAVELLTEPFRQMHFFCVHDAHKAGEKWPKRGCCLYQDTLTIERRQFSSKFNPGPSVRHIPPPAVFCYDLRTGEPTRLASSGGPRRISVLFFWTRWCLSSQTYMKYLIRFAKENAGFHFAAIAVERTKSPADVRELNRIVQENNWHLDGKIQHFYTMENEKAAEMEQQPRNAVEVLSIVGVPFFIVIHPEDYIAFRGRYCAADFSAFNSFLATTLRAVSSKSFTEEPKDWMKGVDNMLDHAALRHRQAESVLRVHQASSYQQNGSALMTGPSKLQSQPAKSVSEDRPPTAARPASRLFLRSSNRTPQPRSGASSSLGVNRISVNTRPFSAHSDASPKRSASPLRRPTSANKSTH